MKIVRLWPVVASMFLATACTQSNPHISDIQTKLDEATRGLAAAQAQLGVLEKRVSSLESSNSTRDLVDQMEETAYLTPGTDGYSVVKCGIGYITVSLANVEPYANGSRVTLEFGNPLAGSLNGVKATLEWGTTNASGTPDNEDERSRDITLVKPLVGGSWTSVTVVLDAMPPTKLGFVRVTNITNSSMGLNRG